MSNTGNNYNQNMFERSKGANDVVREVMGSLADQAVRGFTNVHNTAWTLDREMVLNQIQLAHAEAKKAAQIPVEPKSNEHLLASVTNIATHRTHLEDAGRAAYDLASPAEDIQNEITSQSDAA